MPAMTPQRIQQELLELAMLEDNLKCNGWNGKTCENDANNVIICSCKTGREPMCATCLAKAREHSKSKLFGLIRPHVVFTDTCKHAVRFDACTIIPL